MKKVEYTCDRCGLPIDDIRGGELCALYYEGSMGHNKFPSYGLHYHYACFLDVVVLLTQPKK